MYGSNFFNPNIYSAGNIFNSTNTLNSMSRIGLGKGFFSNLFKNFSLSGFLSGTSKTLNVINQAIPIYYQVKPMISNAKTMFKVMNAVKTDEPKVNNTITKTESIKISNGNPTFFI